MVSLLRRRAMMVRKSGGGGGRLPAGYTEVEYLEGTGTQYIITDIVPLDTRTDADIQYGYIGSSADGYIAAKYDANQRYNGLCKAKNNKFVYAARTNTQEWTSTFDTNRHTFIYNDSSHGSWLDGTLVSTSSGFACTAGTTPIALYARWRSDGDTPYAQNISPAKIYSIKFTDNPTGNVLGEFVPCINPNNEAGMYDLISEKFYGNDGTGNFTTGSPV